MSKIPVIKMTDYPSLRMDHPKASCTDLNIVGLDLKIYGLEEIKGSSKPIAAVIATHGRLLAEKDMAHFVHGLLGHVGELSSAASEEKKRDIIVISLDQRNHGKRLGNKTSNLAFDENPTHLNDMTATVVGGCQDASLIINFLESYLFPLGERVVDEWIATGVSLGGYVTWRLLREEPRITIAIPIIGLPFEAFTPCLKARAESLGFEFKPPIYPPSLKSLLEAPVPPGVYQGKKILSIHGETDTLVPYKFAEEVVQNIIAEAGDGSVEVWVRDDTWHEVTPDMVKRTAEWIWRWALKA